MGYSYTAIATGYSTFTPTFKTIGTDSFYLSDILPQRTTTEAYATTGKSGVCKGNIRVQLLGSNGAYSEVYSFYSTDPKNGTNYNKWYKLDGSTLVEIGATEVSLPAGTGFAVNNLLGAASYLQLKKPL